MLNLSDHSINHLVTPAKYKSLRKVNEEYGVNYGTLTHVISGLFFLILLTMFLPWTQNVRAKGNLIALDPDQRPQSIQSIIDGRIEQWYVQEGQFVRQGDTILRISEIKDDYFDPNLLENTQIQLDAKRFSVASFQEKVVAIEQQISAMEKERKLKLEQAVNKIEQDRLKVVSDSIDLEAAKIDFQIANEQYVRIKTLFDEGLRSLTELENRNLRLQESQAKLVSQENKLLKSRNELINSRIELNRINAEYADKISKARSDRFASLSSQFNTDAEIGKLQNSFANYKFRTGLYYITAPQDGYITEAKTVGIGETVKEGQPIVTVMPYKYDLALQMFVKPIDLPLFESGQKVMIQFDGWPAVIFSGWPTISFGTFEGKVFAIDNFISPNSLYRVVVVPSPSAEPWPEQLRVGAGVKTITLLKNVPVWYEIWRQINGFPPDYYKGNIATIERK
jgi:membrane fusion protein, adhesin transport system